MADAPAVRERFPGTLWVAAAFLAIQMLPWPFILLSDDPVDRPLAFIGLVFLLCMSLLSVRRIRRRAVGPVRHGRSASRMTSAPGADRTLRARRPASRLGRTGPGGPGPVSSPR